MELIFKKIKSWPKLAWVAILSEKKKAEILHGPMVEIHNDWAIEGVWDGAFDKGNFDCSDLIFGSGIRKRKEELIFVSSATGIDRLCHTTVQNISYVSNTLPGLLSVSNISLRQDYSHYSDDIMTIERKGLYRYTKQIPSSGSDINLVYYKNLIWKSKSIIEIDKPSITPNFTDFDSYEQFLKETAEKLGKNASSIKRRFQIEMLAGISSGYDSVATAVISRYAGCKKAATITNSSSLWRGSDSGVDIAEKLGLSCQQVKHSKKKYKKEIFCWASAGHAGGRNFTLFDYPKPLCLFFNGSYGDVVWDRLHQNLVEPKGDMDALLCEFRLEEGLFVTVVPWWGIKNAKGIQKISLLEEMKPWTLGTSYDRPIARRLAEEAGIERSSFGIRKKNTASNETLFWPSTSEARKYLEKFTQSLNIKSPTPLKIYIFSKLFLLLNVIYKNTAKKLKIKQWWRPWEKFPCRQVLFLWANHTLRDVYYKTQRNRNSSLTLKNKSSNN